MEVAWGWVLCSVVVAIWATGDILAYYWPPPATGIPWIGYTIVWVCGFGLLFGLSILVGCGLTVGAKIGELLWK